MRMHWHVTELIQNDVVGCKDGPSQSTCCRAGSRPDSNQSTNCANVHSSSISSHEIDLGDVWSIKIAGLSEAELWKSGELMTFLAYCVQLTHR